MSFSTYISRNRSVGGSVKVVEALRMVTEKTVAFVPPSSLTVNPKVDAQSNVSIVSLGIVEEFETLTAASHRVRYELRLLTVWIRLCVLQCFLVCPQLRFRFREGQQRNCHLDFVIIERALKRRPKQLNRPLDVVPRITDLSNHFERTRFRRTEHTVPKNLRNQLLVDTLLSRHRIPLSGACQGRTYVDV